MGEQVLAHVLVFEFPYLFGEKKEAVSSGIEGFKFASPLVFSSGGTRSIFTRELVFTGILL